MKIGCLGQVYSDKVGRGNRPCLNLGRQGNMHLAIQIGPGLQTWLGGGRSSNNTDRLTAKNHRTTPAHTRVVETCTRGGVPPGEARAAVTPNHGQPGRKSLRGVCQRPHGTQAKR